MALFDPDVWMQGEPCEGWLHAYRSRRWARTIELLLRNTAPSDNGCAIWQGDLSGSGYPVKQIRNDYNHENILLHRVVVECVNGAPLGSQHAHHKCGVRTCISPDHLQAVTHYDNIAEMLARKSFVMRIDELTEALREAVPEHPVLDRVLYGTEADRVTN